MHSKTKKLISPWVGPVKIQAILDPTHFLLSDWEGKCLPVEVEIHRIKPYSMSLEFEGEIMSLDNIYKHLEEARLQQSQLVYRDHLAKQHQSDKVTQTEIDDPP